MTWCSGAPPAHAQGAPTQWHVQTWIGGHAGIDLGYAALGMGVFLSARYLLDTAHGNIAPLDGAGFRAHHEAADVASDIAVFAGLPVIAAIAYAADGSSAVHYGRNPWVGALRVPLVLAEAWIVTNAIAAVIKNAGVCRPYAWQDGTQTCSNNSEHGDADWTHSAFLSGHSANVAAAGGALLGLWLFPTNSTTGIGAVALTTSALSLAVAILRVAAGAHSFADVGAGLALGFGVGLGTAALHLTPSERTSTVRVTLRSLSIAF